MMIIHPINKRSQRVVVWHKLYGCCRAQSKFLTRQLTTPIGSAKGNVENQHKETKETPSFTWVTARAIKVAGKEESLPGNASCKNEVKHDCLGLSSLFGMHVCHLKMQHGRTTEFIET